MKLLRQLKNRKIRIKRCLLRLKEACQTSLFLCRQRKSNMIKLL
ncbi:hypothetical protein ANACAC_01992 [Anaerostipes caccae L1-92]|uniref:Uncharacterized protein n=1 Tax=Anaerostipes caccae (strain DSM 14662 / CCUG 47493 / JCM 13470 / NCIMB 13811 / L1-92) TaxID=411490 RepID=B0MEJ7_ANACD|nr:hypothetical protein ANACAC_01992 [Anaerostipes caccae L1-92]